MRQFIPPIQICWLYSGHSRGNVLTLWYLFSTQSVCLFWKSSKWKKFIAPSLSIRVDQAVIPRHEGAGPIMCGIVITKLYPQCQTFLCCTKSQRLWFGYISCAILPAPQAVCRLKQERTGYHFKNTGRAAPSSCPCITGRTTVCPRAEWERAPTVRMIDRKSVV